MSNSDAGTFPVCAAACGECLFSNQRIVSQKRASAVVRECLQRDTTFLCHKGTLAGREVTCRGFWDRYPGIGQLRRIAERLGVVRFVDVPETQP